MSERRAILEIGYHQFLTDVSTAIFIEEKLQGMVQVTTKYLDPDTYNVEPNGLLHLRSEHPVTVEAKLVESHYTYMGDSQWYNRVIEDHNERAEDAA